jgi:hypothetical protein
MSEHDSTKFDMPAVPAPPPPAEVPTGADGRPLLRVRQKTDEPRPDPLAQQKKKRWRGFFIGLIVGQALIVGLNYGLPWLLKLAADKVKMSQSIPLPLLIFLGIGGGLAITAVLIAVCLFFAALRGAVKGGSVWSGIKRVFRAGIVIGFTAAVLGGTAFVMIPTGEWKAVPGQVKEIVTGLWEKIREAARRQ